jgi:hypothetical protein
MIKKLPWAEIVITMLALAAGVGVYMYAHRDEGRLEASKERGAQVVAALGVVPRRGGHVSGAAGRARAAAPGGDPAARVGTGPVVVPPLHARGRERRSERRGERRRILPALGGRERERVPGPGDGRVSANQIASDVGAEVLRNGGNAVDAAIATGFALAVVHPSAGNIGGGGFMVIRFPDGRATAIDFREKAPLRAHPEMFVDPATGEYSSRIHHNSHLAVGVPGTVAGFDYAHRQYGSADWSSLVEPSVRAGTRRLPAVDDALARSLAACWRPMEDYPASIAAFSRDGTPYEAGEVWRQPDLARSRSSASGPAA